jgi:acetyl-CoA acetyltransferase
VSSHPYSNVAITAVHNTRVARVLEGYTSRSLSCEAALAVLAKAGLDRNAIDGVAGPLATELTYYLGLGPVWTTPAVGINLLRQVTNAIAVGNAHTVLVVDASAGLYTDRDGTAPWTRPSNEFVVSAGMFTTAEFALLARRHMEVFGTTPEHLATVAAIIRNNGHINPQATYFGRGPFTAEDVLASRMIAEPFHLLDCCMTSEGGCAMVMTTADRAKDMPGPPVYVLGVGDDYMGPYYQHPPSWDLRSTVDPDGIPNGFLGRRAARAAFSMAGLSPTDVDVCEFYDNFSFDVIRQYEAFEFCGDGEGGDFVMEGNVSPGGRYPVATDGGLMSFNHSGSPQQLQRVVRSVQQLRGACETNQVPGAEVAMCSANGPASLAHNVALLGTARP